MEQVDNIIACLIVRPLIYGPLNKLKDEKLSRISQLNSFLILSTLTFVEKNISRRRKEVDFEFWEDEPLVSNNWANSFDVSGRSSRRGDRWPQSAWWLGSDPIGRSRTSSLTNHSIDDNLESTNSLIPRCFMSYGRHKQQEQGRCPYLRSSKRIKVKAWWLDSIRRLMSEYN